MFVDNLQTETKAFYVDERHNYENKNDFQSLFGTKASKKNSRKTLKLVSCSIGVLPLNWLHPSDGKATDLWGEKAQTFLF